MNLKKEIAYLIFEIIICTFIIIFGYYLWNNYDLSSLEIAKSYSDYQKVIVDIDDANNIVLSNNEDDIETNTLYLHNISNTNNSANLILKIDKDNELFKNNTILKIDNNYYNLTNLHSIIKDNYMFIIIEDYTFDSYETKKLEVKIITKEKPNQNIAEYLNYEFITQI